MMIVTITKVRFIDFCKLGLKFNSIFSSLIEKFVRQQPDGLYRGEALMLLGKTAIEIEWNAKEAEKYYSQALTYFRNAREKRDALSMYAPIDGELQAQAKPAQKPTTLDKWKRIIYHEEDPLKLYNSANAPIWYINDREKDCLFYLGFCNFLTEKYSEALKNWQDGCLLDSDIMALEGSNYPNILSRLSAVAKYKQMLFSSDLKKSIKNERDKTKIQLAEFYYILEKWDDMGNLFQKFINEDKSEKSVLALAYIGIGFYQDMSQTTDSREDRLKIAEYFKKGMELGKDTPIEEEGLIRMGFYLQSGTDSFTDGTEMIELYLKKYPKGNYIPQIIFRKGMSSIYDNKLSEAQKYLNELKSKYPDSSYTESLQKKLNDPKFLEYIKQFKQL